MESFNIFCIGKLKLRHRLVEMSLLEIGMNIKPKITKENAIDLVKKLYGFTNFVLEALNGFDDINYHVKVMENAVWPHGYVLKIINVLDSQNTSFIEAQAKMALYLGKNGINVPQPVKNLSGKYHSLEEISQNGTESSGNAVRMLTYLPGQILKNISCTDDILFKMGRLVARVDQTLKNFHHSAYNKKNSIWSMESFPLLRKFTFVVEDSSRNALVNDVVDAFDKEVVSIMDDLEKGIVHGDFNEQNILMEKSEEGIWDISALLDLGDSKISCYVFELAICICYMSLYSLDPLNTGGHVLAGYTTVRHLPENEFRILKVCVCARLCQSLVLCAYSYMNDPGNEYKLSSAKNGWPVLNLLWTTPNEELVGRWKDIIASYQM